MAKKKKAESNTGIVISLVFVVLLCLGLAVSTFMGFSEQGELSTKAKDADKQRVSADAARKWNEYIYLHLKQDLGFPLTKDESDAWGVVRREAESGALAKTMTNKDDIEKMLKKIEDELVYDPVKKTPKATYLGLLKDARENLKVELEKFNKMKQNSDASVVKNDDRAKTSAKENEELRTVNKKLNDDRKQVEDKKSKEFLETVDLNKKVNDDKETAEKKWMGEKQELNDLIAKQKKLIKDLEDRYQKVTVVVAATKLTEHDDPKGKIVRLDRGGSMAYINLGRADNVKPQLTFSVFPADSMKSAGERKAAVEIVSVLDEHLSAARIIDLRDPTRGPVLTGDNLFNLAWNSNLKQHIAIAGMIDLTGDNTDSTDEFMRNLAKQNIVVDAFLDLKNREYPIRGEITVKTNYLVLGPMPEISNNMQESDPRRLQRQLIIERMSEMQNQAALKGVTVVPVQRFLMLIGYKLPKRIAPPDYAMQSGLNLGGQGPVDMPNMKKDKGDNPDMPAKPKAKPMDKDKMDKDKMDKDKADKEKADKEKAKEKADN